MIELIKSMGNFCCKERKKRILEEEAKEGPSIPTKSRLSRITNVEFSKELLNEGLLAVERDKEDELTEKYFLNLL